MSRFKSQSLLPHKMHMVARGWRIILGGGAWLVLPFVVSAQPRQPPSVAPKHDLYALNASYIALLNKERHKVDPAAPTAHFDKLLLVGTVKHNEKMQALDSLFHAKDSPIAELVGNLLDDAPVEPDKLALHIYKRLFASTAGHCEIQESGERSYISISVTADYFVVRLARIPGGGEAGRQLRPQVSR